MYPHISPDGTRIAYSVADSSAHNARIVQRSLAQSRVLRLTDATVHGLAGTLRAQTGRCATPGFARLCWQIEPTLIRDHEGHVVETIG